MRLHHPTAFPVSSHHRCAVNADTLELSCPTFLSVFPLSLTYGRNVSLQKTLCDGEHADDDKAPFKSCYDEDVNRERLASLRAVCAGQSSCSQEVPTVLLDPSCDGLRREMRLEYTCGQYLVFTITMYILPNTWGLFGVIFFPPTLTPSVKQPTTTRVTLPPSLPTLPN